MAVSCYKSNNEGNGPSAQLDVWHLNVTGRRMPSVEVGGSEWWVMNIKRGVIASKTITLKKVNKVRN